MTWSRRFIYRSKGHWELEIGYDDVVFRVHIYRDESRSPKQWVTNTFAPGGAPRPAVIRDAWYTSPEEALEAITRQIVEARRTVRGGRQGDDSVRG